MSKWRFGVLVGLIVAAAGYAGWTFFADRAEEETHFHAAFRVFVNDESVDFSDLKFMHIEPCSEEGVEHAATPEEEQIEKAHLHDNIGDVVHVHGEGTVWRDLFTNLKFDFQSPVFGYVNGGRVDGILDQLIEPYERVLFVSGSYSDLETKAAGLPSVERMREVEEMSESC